MNQLNALSNRVEYYALRDIAVVLDECRFHVFDSNSFWI